MGLIQSRGFLQEEGKSVRVTKREADGRWSASGFEDGGRGHEPRRAGSLQKLEEARRQILLWSLPK